MKYKVLLQQSDEASPFRYLAFPGVIRRGPRSKRPWKTSPTPSGSIWRSLASFARMALCAKSKWKRSHAKAPGVNHQDAIRALEKAGFQVLRQKKHIVMSDGIR
jgi:hypothetical protein